MHMASLDANDLARRESLRDEPVNANPPLGVRPLGRLIVVRRWLKTHDRGEGEEDETLVSESCSMEPYSADVILVRSEDNQHRWLINLKKFEAVEFWEHDQVDAGQ